MCSVTAHTGVPMVMRGASWLRRQAAGAGQRGSRCLRSLQRVHFESIPSMAGKRPIPGSPKLTKSQDVVASFGHATHDAPTSTAATAGPRAPRRAENDPAGRHGSLTPSVPP
jgi:hypothetical protein